jgi:hypothetical protein
MIAGLSPLMVMVGGVVAVVEAEFCVTDSGGFEPEAGLR